MYICIYVCICICVCVCVYISRVSSHGSLVAVVLFGRSVDRRTSRASRMASSRGSSPLCISIFRSGILPASFVLLRGGSNPQSRSVTSISIESRQAFRSQRAFTWDRTKSYVPACRRTLLVSLVSRRSKAIPSRRRRRSLGVSRALFPLPLASLSSHKHVDVRISVPKRVSPTMHDAFNEWRLVEAQAIP